jgi:hypothetical protein
VIKIKDSWGITIAVLIVITAHIVGAFLLTSYRKSLQPPRNIIYNDTDKNYSYNAKLRYNPTISAQLDNPEIFNGLLELPAQSKSIVAYIPSAYLESIMLYEGDRLIGCFVTDTSKLSEPGINLENIFRISGLNTPCQ